MSAWADTLLVLATEEPTSLTDAYAVLKLHAADRPEGDARVVVNQAATRQAGERTFATLERACQTLPRPRAPPRRRDPPRRPRARRDPPADAAAVAPSDLARPPRTWRRSPGVCLPRNTLSRTDTTCGVVRFASDCAAPHMDGGVHALIRSNRDRDLRVDFFRGLALWWIYTDHIPGDVLGDYSLRNFAMCDATEVFVLLAGFGAGLAYGSEMDRQGYLYAAADTLRRAWTLYIAHIFLFVVYTAQVAYSATALDRVFYLEETRLDVLADAPYRALLEALLLRFQPNLLNILPLYVALLLIFAFALPLLRKPTLLFAVSLAGYAVVRVTGINLPRLDRRGLVLQSARLAVPVHDRRHPGLCAAGDAAAALADRSAGGAGAARRD